MKLEIKRRKSKICNKIGGLFAYMKKKQYLCGDFSYEHGRAQSDKTIKRGRSFP